MKHLSHILHIYTRFCACAREHGCKANPAMYLRFLYFRKRYRVTQAEYFQYRLHDSAANHEAFYSKNKKYLCGWKHCKAHYMPGRSRGWYAAHYLDYCISRIVYPGLDARDYFRYEFYNFRHCKRKEFLTEGYQPKLLKAFNKNGDRSIMNDKRKFKTCFPEYTNYRYLSAEDMDPQAFEAFCSGLDRVVVKPQNGAQGKDIYIADVRTPGERDQLFRDVQGEKILLEEPIVQHPDIAALNPTSVNTIRVYSAFKNGEIIILGTVLRIGGGNMVVDNYSSGGMAAALDTETGIVISSAISKNNNRCFIHPHTGAVIIGTRVPHWDKVLCAVKSAHARIPDLRYVAWDVVVTAENKIVFLEGNAMGGVELLQHPLLTGQKALYESLM